MDSSDNFEVKHLSEIKDPAPARGPTTLYAYQLGDGEFVWKQELDVGIAKYKATVSHIEEYAPPAVSIDELTKYLINRTDIESQQLLGRIRRSGVSADA
jgi:hypothetical protein